MAITYSFEVKDKVLKVATHGRDESLEEVANYGRELLGLTIKNECSMILCDERDLEYRLSTIDNFELAEAASKEARNLYKIAIVCQEKYLEDGKFFETVSTNRGLTILVTSDMRQANEWLN